MLYLLGPLKVEIEPFNIHAVYESGETEFAIKPVAGAEPPLEYVGEGSNEISLEGRLFPEALGGLGSLELLRQMRASGRPQYLMRGDGRPFGWHTILNHQTRSRYLDGQGVGKMVNVLIRLRRSRSPSAASFFSLMQGII